MSNAQNNQLSLAANVRNFGAVGDGTTDDTAAITAAIAATRGVVYFPAGSYLVTDTLTVTADRITLQGDGPNKTLIVFNPTTAKTCFDLTKGASSIVQCAVKGFGFSSGNSINKTAIKIRDGRHCVVEDIGIAQGAWLGSGSVGLHTLGRDTLVAGRFAVLCARPILMGVNPNYTTLNTDHFHFHDIEVGSTEGTGKAIEIETGVNISNLTFDGFQAWTLGKYGLFWDDTTSTIDSYNLTIAGMRCEQASDATGYSVYLASTAQDLKALRIVNGYFDLARNGLYLRKAETVSLDDCFFAGGVGRTNLNITFQANTELALNNTFVNTGSTVTLTSAVALVESSYITSNRACASTALWRFDEGALVSRKAHRLDGVLGFRWKGSMTDVSQINLPVTSAAGAVVANWRVSASGATKHQAGVGSWKPGVAPLIVSGSADVVNTSTANKFAVIDNTNALSLVNRLGETVTVVVDVVWAD
jgi:hypothetical protein